MDEVVKRNISRKKKFKKSFFGDKLEKKFFLDGVKK